MQNVIKPRTVSFEDALRNLASRLTGTPAHALPRTQEGVVQYMAETVPSVEEMAEAVTQEVLARLGVKKAQDAPAGDEDGQQTPEPPAEQQEAETQPDTPTEGTAAKSGSKSRKTK